MFLKKTYLPLKINIELSNNDITQTTFNAENTVWMKLFYNIVLHQDAEQYRTPFLIIRPTCADGGKITW